MVHRGKLSAACGPCRSRRLKCDHKKPSCSQCIRAQRECSGYRDVSAGRFYDQTEEVKKKNSPSSSAPTPPPRQQTSSPSTALVRQQITVPLQDQGAAFALSRYLSRSVGINLPHILGTTTGRAVTASINAVGLAALSNIHQSMELMLTARREYVSALKETNAVLSDPFQATSNASVVAVSFLGMFEMMACDGSSLMDKYVKHLDGSLKLLQLRGTEQLQDPVGLGLFTQSRTPIVLGNFWLKRSTPSWLVQLSHEATVYRGEGSTGSEDALFILMTRVGDLCSSLRNGLFIEPAKFVKKALELDIELNAWARSVELERRYTVVNVPAPLQGNGSGSSSCRSIYGDHYHIYPDTVISAWWNDYRFVRLILHEVICWLACHLSRKEDLEATVRQKYAQTVANSRMVSQQMAEDICASVPYHLGATETSPYEDWDSTRTGGVIRLIWPLFVAAERDGATSEATDWIADTLFKIGYGVGIRQALVMSNLLRSGRDLSWLPDL
ncbi:Zn(II)2Cys6 transcription factor [Aspergillus mulundensis]|uniref:Putative Zn(II)2Cys6 transcription factor n=1 Tax=Aspergillus mulundensis TaxID=1810919 RepID=A0A3D8SVK5_9EURO|nr:putative Zn(II)2Cys6 transcription factor [Aspergillus mulundensis]RDW90304.1 putative Zn(II)2Cys6 transcription factor [Aspergillus mulundensis]